MNRFISLIILLCFLFFSCTPLTYQATVQSNSSELEQKLHSYNDKGSFSTFTSYTSTKSAINMDETVDMALSFINDPDNIIHSLQKEGKDNEASLITTMITGTSVNEIYNSMSSIDSDMAEYYITSVQECINTVQNDLGKEDLSKAQVLCIKTNNNTNSSYKFTLC